MDQMCVTYCLRNFDSEPCPTLDGHTIFYWLVFQDVNYNKWPAFVPTALDCRSTSNVTGCKITSFDPVHLHKFTGKCNFQTGFKDHGSLQDGQERRRFCCRPLRKSLDYDDPRWCSRSKVRCSCEPEEGTISTKSLCWRGRRDKGYCTTSWWYDWNKRPATASWREIDLLEPL